MHVVLLLSMACVRNNFTLGLDMYFVLWANSRTVETLLMELSVTSPWVSLLGDLYMKDKCLATYVVESAEQFEFWIMADQDIWSGLLGTIISSTSSPTMYLKMSK